MEFFSGCCCHSRTSDTAEREEKFALSVGKFTRHRIITSPVNEQASGARFIFKSTQMIMNIIYTNRSRKTWEESFYLPRNLFFSSCSHRAQYFFGIVMMKAIGPFCTVNGIRSEDEEGKTLIIFALK